MDAEGVTTAVETVSDDGRKEAVKFDSSDDQPWSEYIDQWDAFNNLTQHTVFADDASWLDLKFDFGNTEQWTRQLVAHNPDGAIEVAVTLDDAAQVSVQYSGGNLIGGAAIGNFLGSQIGNLMASHLGGNPFAGVAAGSLVTAIGHELGQAIQFGSISTALPDFIFGTTRFDTAVNGSMADRQPGYLGGFAGAAIGQLSALLTAELTHELGLDGFAGGLVQTVGTSVTTQLVTNLYNVAAFSLQGDTSATVHLFDGFSTGAFFANMVGAVGGRLGALAAHAVLPAHTPAEAIASSIGSSVGAFLGTFIPIPIPGVGTAFGAFVGGIVGELFGSTFGVSHSEGMVWLDPMTGRFVDGNFSKDNGGDATGFFNIANAQVQALNALLDYTGAIVPHDSSGVKGLPVSSIRYWQDGTDYYLFGQGGGVVDAVINLSDPNQLAPFVDSGLMELIHHTDLIGGDPIMRLAWENSRATNSTAFAADLQFAHDYRLYLDNMPVINALIAAEPDSAFTAGWVITLLKAEELGLNAPIQGGAGDDTLHGTAGHDQLDGGAGNDVLYGEGGDDTLNGNAGNDVLDGGLGTDTAVFDGAFGNYIVTFYNGELHVATSGGGDHDRLFGIDRLHFSDRIIGVGAVGTFKALDYIASYGDLIDAFHTDSQAGFDYYINYGFAQGRHTTFNGLDYIASYSDLIDAYGADEGAGAMHFIVDGYNNGRHVSFNGLTYIASHGDLIDALGADERAGAVHFIQTGYHEGRQVSFNGLDYIASYSDLIDAYGANEVAGARHFIVDGYNSGRHVSFSGLNYIASYSDLISAFGADERAGAIHFVQTGYHEGRQVSFNGLDYIASYSDLIDAYGANEVAGATHFIVTGHGEGRHISFSGLNYIASYSDLIDAFGADERAGAIHFVQTGYHEGRHASFNPASYLAVNPDVQAALGNDLVAAAIHYIDQGYQEGRYQSNVSPTNATLSGGTVFENSANGTVAGTVTGFDPNMGSVLSYALTDDSSGRFALNATTGVITVANGALLDFESATSHDVTVRVTDQDGLAFDKVFTIGISDVAPLNLTGDNNNNTLIGSPENDTLQGLGGADTLFGGDGDDAVFGGDDADIINGGAGNDVLDGGGGNDILTGGPGSDQFRFNSLNEMGKLVTDFQPGTGGDVLDLHNLLVSVGYTGSNGLLDGLVREIQNGVDTEIQIDAHSPQHDWITAATLQNVNVASLGASNYLF